MLRGSMILTRLGSFARRENLNPNSIVFFSVPSLSLKLSARLFKSQLGVELKTVSSLLARGFELAIVKDVGSGPSVSLGEVKPARDCLYLDWNRGMGMSWQQALDKYFI